MRRVVRKAERREEARVAVRPRDWIALPTGPAHAHQMVNASASEPLVAGTLLGSGTVGGGCGVELGRRLRPRDVVELEIEGIGVLRNRLGPRPAVGWMPSAKSASR